jgi:hypothetical protein
MADVLLNGRKATDWELAAIERGRQHERDRDRELLAGVLTGDPRRRPERPRPVTDIPAGFN